MNKQPNSNHCFICGVQNVAGVQVAFYETVNTEVSASGKYFKMALGEIAAGDAETLGWRVYEDIPAV